MLPYLLAVVGGYLLGQSESESSVVPYKKGGYVIKRKEGENFKPSFEFDKKYGTKISKTDWKFPENFDGDYVYEKIITPMFRENVGKKKQEYFGNYLEKLEAGNENGNYFQIKSSDDMIVWNSPYYILNGMASGFNYDDIVYFIKDWNPNSPKRKAERRKIEKELMNLGVESTSDMQWIISPKTFEKIKKQLSK